MFDYITKICIKKQDIWYSTMILFNDLEKKTAPESVKSDTFSFCKAIQKATIGW